MDFFTVCAVALLASALTLYSGFGLGTLLLPAFALFFPVPVAVAATAVVHLLNNLFKGTLLHRSADWPTVLRFGLPAIPAAILGAWLLDSLGEVPRVFVLEMFGRAFAPSGAGLAVGLLLIVLAALELQPWFQRLAAPRRLLPLGGVLTGFLGGLSGQQGALRSIFLLRTGLDAQRFIATGVMIAVLIDAARLPTYAAGMTGAGAMSRHEWLLIAAGTLSAFAGAWLATRHMKKVTIAMVRAVVAALMFVIGGLMTVGVIG